LATCWQGSILDLASTRQFAAQQVPSTWWAICWPGIRVDGSLLGRSGVGPTWLKREEIADVVEESIHFGADHLDYYSLP
jgi:hypothetical protein